MSLLIAPLTFMRNRLVGTIQPPNGLVNSLMFQRFLRVHYKGKRATQRGWNHQVSTYPFHCRSIHFPCRRIPVEAVQERFVVSRSILGQILESGAAGGRRLLYVFRQTMCERTSQELPVPRRWQILNDVRPSLG